MGAALKSAFHAIGNTIGGSPGTNMNMEPAPKPRGPEANSAEARATAERQRKRAAAGESRADTLYTGARGLGEVPNQNLQPKTLLGY